MGLPLTLPLSAIPDGLRNPLLEEYNKLAKNFREGRWEPAELNGGKFCEVVYSILRGHIDGSFAGSPFKPANMFRDCVALEQAGSTFPRSIRIQIPRMLIALYEIRNQRNVGHVGADVDPNHMDATVVYSIAKWILAELVRVFHTVTIQEAAQIVEDITTKLIPIVWSGVDFTRVLGRLSAKQKTLVLLYAAGKAVPVDALVAATEYGNVSRYRSSVLADAHKNDLLHFDRKTDTAVISPVGVNFVERNIPLEIVSD